ncbi:Dihydroorotate dehydrogenase-domain-containing protein [Gaertneriomyces semiglobifer]|nr:Dihydroorotate dehydrogenase-domain-containing protein [Gaertneriomyces semiglobifer]
MMTGRLAAAAFYSRSAINVPLRFGVRVAPAGSRLRAARSFEGSRFIGTTTTGTTEFSSAYSRLTTFASFVAGSSLAILAYLYLSDTRASVHRHVFMPILHAAMDAEDAHKFSIWLAKHKLVPSQKVPDDIVLHTSIWGKEVSNPIMLAAGYDKNAEAIDSLLRFGFGGVEVGSVTPQPQPGNPQPRMFRLPADLAVINRYGFNSDGHDVVLQRLKKRVRAYLNQHQHDEPAQLSSVPKSLHQDKLLGINLGKNKISPAESNDDYTDGVATLGPCADYLVVNISSPNTPGLRALQRREPIEKLLKDVMEERNKLENKPPVVVKIAPDLSQTELEDIAEVVKSVGVDGVIISNTTISRPATLLSPKSVTTETGGLSGPPLHPLSLATVKRFYQLTDGKVPIIGAGGVKSAEEVLNFAKAGARMVQLYSVMAYEGPGLVDEIKRETAQILRKQGKTWNEIVGQDHRK